MTGKGLQRALGAAGVLVLTVAAGGSAWAGEPVPDPADTPEAARWASVVPLPAGRFPGVGVWSPGPVVTVAWGPAAGEERESLADRLDRTFGPLGRSWRAVTATEVPDLSFADVGGEGEGYTLKVTPAGVVAGASGPAGRYYALVTLAQMLPPRARTSQRVAAASGTTVDSPAFGWRGLMVDVSRHFVSVANLERILELMALHKLNRFHWHLTDDQGWRLEVPGWPLLTETGAWRTEADGSRYGGFYTAAEVRRVVAFAAQRQITVVPEVDLPGHASAALSAYPELSADGKPRAVPLDWGAADGVLALGTAPVSRFADDVLAALVGLFPGPWIHWGGDEVYRTPWMKNAESLAWMRSVGAGTADEAVGAFWSGLARNTLAAGKVPIGWDDVASGPLPEGTIVQWWDTSARPLSALMAGHPLIVSWQDGAYLDYPEVAGDADRAWWMPLQTLETIAAMPYWPPGTPQDRQTLVLGLEAGLWTERAPQERLDRKLFPRLALVAEDAWRGVSGGVPGWQGRIADHRTRLEAWGVGMVPPDR